MVYAYKLVSCIYLLVLDLTPYFLFRLQVSKVRWDQLDHLGRLEEPDKKDQSDYPAETENKDPREPRDFQVQ